MFKVTISSKNNDPRSPWVAMFDSQEEAKNWLEKQKQKEGRRDSHTVELLNENNELEVKTVEAEAEFLIEDLSKDVKFLNEEVLKTRMKNYPKVEELLHVLCDHGLESDEWKSLMEKRNEVKSKFPKVSNK